MSGGSFDGQNYPSGTSHSPEAPIRKKRQMSLHGPSMPGDLPPQPASMVEIARRSSLQPVSGSTLQNLQGQFRIAPPLPIRSSTTHLPGEVQGPYRAVVVPPVTQSPPKPLRKDQVYMFEFACENRSLGIALGIGRHDPIHWKSTVQGNGIAYQRKENGDYFQVEELSTAQDFGLRRGDEVLSINGCMLYKYSLDYAGILLAEAASCGHVTLAITRPKRTPSRADYSGSRQSQLSESFESVTDSLSTTQSTTDTTAAERSSLLSYSEPFNVDLYKEEDGKSLGIGIVGGVDAPLGPIGFFIKTIYPSGLVGEDGRLKTGDEIILLNGVPLQGLRHSEAINKFKLLPSGPVRLTVRSLVHSAGPSKPSTELKDSSQRVKNSADSHSTRSSSLFSENVRSDSLLDEILLEYGKQDKLETDYADIATGKTISSGNETHSSLLTETKKNSPFPTVSIADSLTSKIVISQPNARTSNMSVPNALVTDEEFQSPLVTDPGSYYETGYLDFYGNPVPDSGSIRPNVKEPELIVKHRVINLYQNPPAATEIAGERSDDDGLFSQETDFGVPPPPIKPGDILGSYLVTKKSSEASEATAEYFVPPHEFTSTMYIADDSDEDGNGDAGSRSFQKNVGDDSHSAMAVAWSGMQNDDFLSGIGAPVGFGDDQRQNQRESQRELTENSKLPNRVESGTSGPLWKDFDLLGSDTQKLVTEESVFGVKAWSNSSHNSQTYTANGTSLNPFADGASLSNSNIFDSAHHEVFNVRNGAFGAESGQREPRESTSDNSLQDTLSPYETSLSSDAEKWFSVESPDPGTSNVPQKRLILVGEIELAPPPPNFSGVKLNGGESVRPHPEEHHNELSASSRFKEEEDVKTDRFNMRPAINSTSNTSEKTPFSEVPPFAIDSESSMTEKDACVDEADADAWLEACIPSGKHDSSASSPKLDNELLSHQETSRPEDPGTVPFSAGDHDATTVLSSSALPPPPPPSLLSDYNSSESLLDMSEPPPLPSSAPPPLPDTPPPPLTGHRYAYDLHLETEAVSDFAPPANNLFTDDFVAFDGSDFDPPAWKSDRSQELTYDVSHNSASMHNAHQHQLDVPGKALMTSTEFHGLPAIPKDQGSHSPWSSHKTFTGSLLSDQHSEFRAGSSKAPALTADSEMFRCVADKPDFLSYSQPPDSVNDQVKASSTSYSTSQADVATFGDQVTPEEGNKIRSETEPFQVKVNKNLWGLGMTVSVTAKGAVITDIQAMSPVGKIGDIRVNDYLLAVNGIRIGDQRTEEIQEFLNTLPAGIVRLTVSALPPTSASYDQEQFENQLVDGKRMTEAQNATPSQDLSYQMKSLSSPYVDLYAASPISTPTSASITDALSISRRSISRDEIVGSVLKDYYTVADKPKEETSNKPKKPLIAQALLPKSKRSGSLVPGSASSTPDAKTSRSLSSASSHSECLDALSSERKPSEDVTNNSVFDEPSTINFPVSKDLVTPISSSWSLKTRKLAFEEGDADESSTKEQTKPADQSKISDSELQFNMGRYAKGVDSFEKDEDDSASVQSDSSSIHSAGYSSQSSENSALSRSRVLAEVETEYAKKVASSKAFFESIQADSKKAPSSKQSGSKSNRTSEVTPRSTDFQLNSSTDPKMADNDDQDLILKSEPVTPLRETPVDSENLNIAESKAFFKSMENSKKQSGSSRNLPDSPVQTSVSCEAPKLQRESRVMPEVDSRMLSEVQSVSEFQSSGKNMSSGAEIRESLIENEHSDRKLRETREVLDSESINVADSKAFFKSMESTSKRSSKPVSKAAQNLPVIGSKTGINITANAEPKGFMARRNEGRADEFPKFTNSSEPENSNEKMQEMKQKNSDNETNQVELIKVTETKAFFESLKPPTSSVDRDKIELKSQPPGGTPNQTSVADLDKPRAVVQPVSRKESAGNVNQHTTGRLPTLPSQKYLPVPSGPLPKLSPISSALLRPPHKSMPLVQGNPSSSVSSAPQTPDAPKERKDISVVNSADATENQEQQKSVGNLVSKFATFSPEPKATFSGEPKPDAALHVKRESPGQVRYQYGGTGDSSKSPAADSTASPASADAWKMKRPIPPSGPPPSATTPSQSASPMPVIGSSNKSQKWKQFMTNYSSMK